MAPVWDGLCSQILQNKGTLNALAAAYDEITKDQQRTMATRATTREELNSISLRKEVYHHSFLQRTIRNRIYEAPLQNVAILNSLDLWP